MAELLLLLICLLISTMNTAANGQVWQSEPISMNNKPVIPPAIQSSERNRFFISEQAIDKMKQVYGKDSIIPQAPLKPTLQSCEGQATWCIAKPATGDERLYANIEFCCNDPRIDCRIIQPGGRCYNPNNNYLQASVVMNLYYKAYNKPPNTCDFIGSGLIISQDPSMGECIFEA